MEGAIIPLPAETEGEKPDRTPKREGDPTTYTQISPVEPLRRIVIDREDPNDRTVRYPEYEDSAGNRYVDITDKFQARHSSLPSGAKETIIASLLKYVLNVSDIVVYTPDGGNRRYLSRVMPIDLVEPAQPGEMQVDVALLQNVFEDIDHLASGLNLVHGKNGAYVHFDFALAFMDETKGVMPQQTLRDLDPSQLPLLIKKLDALERLLSGDQGLSFLNAVYRHAGETHLRAESPDGTIATYAPEQLQRLLLENISHTRALIEGRRPDVLG